MHRRCFLKSLAATPAACLAHLPLMSEEAFAQQRGDAAQPEPFKPSEGANNPIGESTAIHPGRVVWARDPEATSWDGSTGRWWDDAHTDQRAVNRMISWLLQQGTGMKNDKQAWDALFRHFNQTHRLGNAGYRRGEKIAIKINCNQDRSPEWGVPPQSPAGRRPRPPQNGLPSPHVVLGLLAQLIEVAGVPGEDIVVYEVASGRNIGGPIVERVRANPDRNFQRVRFVVNNDQGLGGRIAPMPDKNNPIHFSGPEMPVAYLPQQVTEAKYMINVALLRPHGMAGVTLIGKNHFGSLYFPEQGWTPVPLHPYVSRNQAMGSYNALVDLMAHRHLGGKTFLYMLDGLYTAEHNEGNVFRFASFGEQWASSLLLSQDPVALDSVGLDILSAEPKATQVRGNADNYLHEAALVGKPQSGTRYDPAKTGSPPASLGVHEHWNNATEKKYSRNLGRKVGIELIASV
ncbi:MAG TPA: DUF362 domain-containing protein [Bryobacteraceae bacterium]|nr:DUF362 domain-containing protein [Bryobacteraceae bacterium]HPU73408.1 DUF362 domain-containing protein [Bryobacteraceae bacterium]